MQLMNFMKLDKSNVKELSYDRLSKLVLHEKLSVDREFSLVLLICNWVIENQNIASSNNSNNNNNNSNQIDKKRIQTLFKKAISFSRLLVECSPDEIKYLTNHSAFYGLDKLWLRAYQQRDLVLEQPWSLNNIECLLPRLINNNALLVISNLDNPAGT